MLRIFREAPGRARRVRPGSFFWLLLVLVTASCERIAREDSRTLELSEDTIQLERGKRIVDVRLHAVGDSAGLQPSSIQARSGDVLRITAADAHTHAIAFDPAGLSAEAREFLESTSQLRGPPLVERGASWVVSLDGAPAGDYALHCLTHAHRATLRVQPRPAAGS